MRSVLLWAVGVPLPLILLLAFCTHHLWPTVGRGSLSRKAVGAWRALAGASEQRRLAIQMN